MRSSSRKAKGRRLQQKIREDLRSIGEAYGLEADDIESRQMGGAGVDIVLSPAARRVFPFDVEAKNCESLNVVKVFRDHHTKYSKTKNLKMVIHAKNHCEPMITVRWKDFLKLYSAYLKVKNRKA